MLKCGHDDEKLVFYKIRGILRPSCKECRRQSVRKYRQNHPEKRKALKAAQYRRNPLRVKLTKISWQYHISPMQYADMLYKQDNKCAACNEPFLEEHRICIDHNHSCCPEKAKSCGKCVVGLVHEWCNKIEGFAKSNPKLLRAIADYIERTR